jgi:hypothetical protein
MNRSQEEFYWTRMFERFSKLEKKVDNLSKQLNYLVKDKGNDS